MSRVVQFYRLENVHPLKYTIEEMWQWDDRQLEKMHNYIQWWFPLDEPSGNSLGAPILTMDEIEQFHTDKEIRVRLLKSFSIMMNYYGFAFDDKTGKIGKAKDFEKHSGWLFPDNHNYLRITRILKSMTLLGFPEISKALLGVLEGLYKEYRVYIGPKTWKYWSDSLQ
jgi:hypothetical protein